MPVRVQVILEAAERERFRRRAAEQGVSLSAWLRDAGHQRAAAEQSRKVMRVADLRKLFAGCTERERGREPDWQEHQAVIEASRARGRSGT